MIEITERDFSVEEVISRMNSPKVGGIITYLGTVRGFSEGGKVAGIEFAISEAAAGKISEIEKKALEDFEVEDVAIVHRIGWLKVGDRILLVAVSASHREPAFAACMGIIDAIKVIHANWAREVLLS